MEPQLVEPEPPPPRAPQPPLSRAALAVRWALVVLAGIGVAVLPPPAGIEPRSWQLFAIFVATILGLILQPLPGGAMVLLGVAATAIFGVLEPATALAGYADPVVWLVLSAFMLARGMIKTGFGRRVALLFVRALGGTSLGLGYALALTDGVLASVIPSNSARAGGIVFPITRSIAESYGSQPGPTAARLGAFLLPLVYQTDVIVCAMFLTGQASNPLIAGFTQQVTGIELTYGTWFLGAVVPGLVALALTPLLLFRLFPPEVRRTPKAADYATGELRRMGSLSRSEILMLATFLLVLVLWVTTRWHGIDYTLVAMLGLGTLLITGVLTWQDVITERSAWDVFIWYGGLVLLARELGKTGITEWFAQGTGGLLEGWSWPLSLAVLLLVYFYAHYGFASITAHSSAMLIPFLTVSLVAGAPPLLAALLFAYLSNLCACLTHYGTTPAPIYFGAGYVTQARWWQIGLVVSGPHVLLFPVVGLVWWKLLGWW
ncbi:MAG TPA: DASS family sodium-coupled anion symporter [Thermoanaerobaculia bacterium]|nr:DASS family sodium-coupled anion symporter [Thermoanaerobaculia bacterium]